MMHVNVQDNRKKRVVSCPSTTAEKNEFILPKKEKIQSHQFFVRFLVKVLLPCQV
jgi:hypothetical protein